MGEVELAGVPDADLVRSLRHDADALEEFYRRHVRAVTRFATYQLGDEHAADDIAAATFVAVIESAHRYDPDRAPIRSWLFGIAANLIGTARRRSLAEQRATRRLRGLRPVQTDDLARLEEAIDAGRLTGPADVALRRLPAAERELLTLLLDQRLTVPEAADALGIRAGTARMRLARARARLTPWLADGAAPATGPHAVPAAGPHAAPATGPRSDPAHGPRSDEREGGAR